MKYLHFFINYFLSFGYDIYFAVWGNVRSRIQGISYYRQSKLYPGYLKRGNMAEAVGESALKYCNGKGLDIGAGKWPFPGARVIEDKQNENAYKLLEMDNSQDFIFSSHTLEHLDLWQTALVEWRRVLKPGGVMFLYLPHPACDMWKVGVNSQHRWAPAPQILKTYLVEKLSFSILESTILPDGFLSFMIVARK